jgi:hypothetical protein
MVLLDPDWDHVVATYTARSVQELVVTLERWLERLPDKAAQTADDSA